MRLWVDTDVGTNPDDAVALLCALAHPEVDLAGVSTVGDDARWRAEVARELLPASVPVVAGTAGAAEAIPAAGAGTVLALGPLTNLGALATIGWRPERLVVMGGALADVRHRGRLHRVESNFAADPVAAGVVLGEPGVTVVPLDVTVAARLDGSALGLLVAAAPALVPAVESWLAAQAGTGIAESERAVHLHDPAALLVALGEPLARLEPQRLVVEGDGRLRRHPDGAGHQVVVELDGPAVVHRVLALLAGQ